MKDPAPLCPHCGAKMVEYRHRLNLGLMQGLKTLHRAGGGPINLQALGLTHSEWDNFQKLRYWGLVEQVEVEGQRKRGVWRITELGRAFVLGWAEVCESVWTYRGERVRFEGPQLSVFQVRGFYQQREVWIAEAMPVGIAPPSRQGVLL